MTYQVLARKWRPPDFSSVIGQEPIVTALRNALTEGRIAQAYLFSGIRGVGKTTAARVFAKALNCERGPAADPCNECAPCREIAAAADLDVIEVDAATYSKVEQVRELTESLRYGPARDRYKVVVIDEIHRLSRQAFDALLKIIEEPPPHLVFIFATTEIDAVPATILSRCQEFHFRRVPSETVSNHLRGIAEHEDIEASDAALRLIARAGEGSVRDSLALLDQLATFGSGAVPDEEAMRLLGGMDTALFEQVLTGILSGDRAAVSAAVHRVEEEGWDPRNVFAQFLAYCRDGLHLALAPPNGSEAPAGVDLPAEEAARLSEHAREAGYENLLRLLHQLLSSEETVRRSDASSLALEIAWLRAAELPRLTSVEDLLAGRALSAASANSPAPATAPARRAAAPSKPGPVPEPAPRPAPEPTPRPAPSAPQAPATVEGFLDRLTDLKGALAGHLRQAESLRFEDGMLHVTLASDDDILASRLERPNNRELLDRTVREVFGAEARWRSERGSGTVAQPPPKAAEERPTAEASEDAQVQDNPTVQTVLEIFDGTVEGVEDENEES
jgi:DNA polymerase-3 subunit gamma/tau